MLLPILINLLYAGGFLASLEKTNLGADFLPPTNKKSSLLRKTFYFYEHLYENGSRKTFTYLFR